MSFSPGLDLLPSGFVKFVKALGAKPRRTAYGSPWQNPVAERWIGSLRRELLDHVVVLGQQHLLRLVNSYIRYHHEDRCHLGLGRNTPEGRPVTPRPSPYAKVVVLPRGRAASQISVARSCMM